MKEFLEIGMRINIGCGQTPTAGWRNFDNSMSLRLSGIPLVPGVLKRLGLLTDAQSKFIAFAKNSGVQYGDAVSGLNLGDGIAEVIYTSHMLEHLDRREAMRFLREAMRLLRPGGLIRIAVPDIHKLVSDYTASGDADAFVEATSMCSSRPIGFAGRLRSAIVGVRNHLWMYDGASLVKLLQSAGFSSVKVMPAGVTGIDSPGALDLHERSDESVYVEARKPLP